MQRSIHNQAETYLKKRHKWKTWQKIVSALGCVVVFCTVYALILPAITMEGTAYCGQEEHTHTDSCYTEGETTYKKEQVCSVSNVAHTHSDICYDTYGNLVCTLAEVEAHVHTDACYEEVVVTVETTPETTSIEGEDTGETETTDSEATPATVSEEVVEKRLICEKKELLEHVHSESCFKTTETTGKKTLTCTKEEHTHSLACYSNPNADVETEADWKKTFEDVTLTGEYDVDVLAIAKSQLGYTESTENYTVAADGESINGYTRYGDWYGSTYGEWCAMYVSFCINYAEVEDMPLEAGCQNWINKLKSEEYDLYIDLSDEENADYIPVPGDLIFFNLDSAPDSDHVGLVVEYVEATEEEPAMVKTIEGNSYYKVRYDEYEADSSIIMGYGKLPEQTFYCGAQGHVHTEEECYDDAGELICEMEEHIHTDECEELNELTEEEQAQVDAVIAAIDALPTADEFDAKLLEYEEAEDMDSYEAYWGEIQLAGRAAYDAYEALSEVQKAYVTNIDKLMELEWLWSAVTLNSSVNSAAPTTTWYTSTKDFVELNLYDYNGNVNTNYWSKSNTYPGFQWNGGAYSKSDYQYENTSADLGIPDIVTDRNRIDSIDFGNSLITDSTYGDGSYSKSKNATDVVKTSGSYSDTSAINWIYGNKSEGYTNKPIGVSTTDQTQDENVMSYTLNEEGYPELANGTSLEYLFTTGTAVTKMNTESIDGLFQKDDKSGEYSYNSRENHAQYTNNFFQLYDQIITPNFITYPFGNFLPLNTIDDASKATQVGAINQSGGMKTYVEQTISDLKNNTEGLDSTWKATQNQLVTMLEEYKENWNIYPRTINGTSNNWSNLSPANAIRDYFWGDESGNGDNPSDSTSFITQDYLNSMYNIDWDVQTNFFFGMEMKMNFMMPKDGMTGNDKDGDGDSDYEMKFKFTGDDDVWVYIDGVLFLDLSGIHRHVGGEIDFVKGEVYYYNLDTSGTGDVSSTPYVTKTFAQILTAAGKSTDVLNSKGTFKDYSTHSFNFYYMERGSGSSVCRLNFNFPLLRQNSISVSKEVTADTTILGNPDYKFQVLKADSSGNKTSELFIAAGTKYTIYDENDNVIGTGTTDANGVFTLKAGQRAEFTGIKENTGKYYVRELLEGTVLEQYGNVTVSGESTTTSNNVTVGSDTFTGMDSPVKDMSDGATAFRFTNDVDEKELGTLNISKKITEYSVTRAVKYFDVQVTFDGDLLPVGTKYTVGSETRTVTTAGIITIAADETATITNILAGTEFKIQETSGSAEGYTVTYNDSGGYTITVNDGVVTGIIKTSANVQLVVTNSEKGATVTIPGTKTITNPDGAEHTYTFQLDEVTDSTGQTLKTNGITEYTATATITDQGTFAFNINYVAVEVMNNLPQTYYYKITEQDVDDSITNATTYVVEVTVSEATDGISAAITGMWKDGEKITDSSKYSADFENTLAGDLILSKTVVGNATGAFTFEIKLDSNETKTYSAILTNTDGTNAETEVSFTNGIATVSLQAGESLRIKDIEYGINWTITETNADGYKVTYVIKQNESEDDGNGSESSGAIIVGATNVAYTNTQQYELPESGGIGTNPFIMGGIALMSLAVILLYNKKRGKGERASS